MKKAAVAVAMMFAFAAFGQEHPEHPKSKEEHPKAKKAERTYSVDDLEKAITAEIEAAQEKNGGWYVMKDGDDTWKMKLEKVHRERLSKINAKTYFACTDFKTDDGRTVDVDFFMKDDGEKLVMSDTTIHKVNGKARYNWREKDGYWERVPVE